MKETKAKRPKRPKRPIDQSTNRPSDQSTKLQNAMEYIVIHVAGAVYCLSDMIIFEMLQNATGELCMRIVVQIEDVLQETFVFEWSKIPTEVMQIYNYVNSKSSLKDNILYGTHIGRTQDHKYALMKFKKNPIGEYNTCPLVTSQDADASMFKDMLARMMQAKKLV